MTRVTNGVAVIQSRVAEAPLACASGRTPRSIVGYLPGP